MLAILTKLFAPSNDPVLEEIARLRELGDDLRRRLDAAQRRVEATDEELDVLRRAQEASKGREAVLAEKLAFAEALVQSVPEPILVVDEKETVQYANDACCRMTGYEKGEVEQKLAECKMWSSPTGEHSVVRECLAKQHALVGVTAQLANRRGEVWELQISAVPVRVGGVPRGALVTYRDVTREARLTARLVEAAEKISEVYSCTEQILAAAQAQGTMAAEQATSAANVSTTGAEMASSATQVSDSCAFIAGSMGQLLQSAGAGQQHLGRVMGEMQRLRAMSQTAADQVIELGERSKRIRSVVDLISSVAGETKLIAFNAAIEAARAGEAGLGFAVVASEVKKLAESVAEAAVEIKKMVADIQASTQQSVLASEGQMKSMESAFELVEKSSAAFDEIASFIGEISGSANGMASAAEQQKTVTEQVMSSMNEMSSTAYQSASAAAETFDAVAQLTDFARDLTEALESFKKEHQQAG